MASFTRMNIPAHMVQDVEALMQRLSTGAAATNEHEMGMAYPDGTIVEASDDSDDEPGCFEMVSWNGEAPVLCESRIDTRGRICYRVCESSDKQYYELRDCDKVVDNNKLKVASISMSRKRGDKWQFLVHWEGRGDGRAEWVNDEDCNCEKLIRDHLSNKDINTVYCFSRVSTLSQTGDDHVSLDAQQTGMTKTARTRFPNHRMKIIQHVGSGFKKLSKPLVDMQQYVTEGDVILCYRVDRLTRNLNATLPWLDEMTNKKVNVISTSQNISYMENKSQFTMEILRGQDESETLARRIRDTLSHKRDRGDQRIGGLPYGKKYKRVEIGDSGAGEGDGTKLVVVDDQEAIDTIREVKNLLWDGKSRKRRSPQEVADILNDRGVTKRGRKWSKTMIVNTSHIRV